MSSEPTSVTTPLTSAEARLRGVSQEVPPVAGGKRRVCAATVGGQIVLAVFLIYCLLPATWIVTAMTKDNGQIFSTFGLWFAYPFHFLENLSGLVSYQHGIFFPWFRISFLYSPSLSIASTRLPPLPV